MIGLYLLVTGFAFGLHVVCLGGSELGMFLLNPGQPGIVAQS